MAPNDGPAAGGTSVKITGTSLAGATAVTFGSSTATFVVNSATSITATSPKSAAGVVDIHVSTIGGTSASTAADEFAFMQAPEYGRCLAVSTGTGAYASSSCNKPGGKKKYEWFPAFGGPKPLEHTHFTTHGAATTLETTTRKKIACGAETGTGAYCEP